MTDTNIIAPWTEQIADQQTEPPRILQPDSYIPIHEPALKTEGVIAIATLDDLLPYLKLDCYLRYSHIDGRFYLHVAPEG